MRLALSVLIAAGCSFEARLTAVDSDVDAAIDAPSVPACFEGRCRRLTITIDPAKVAGGPHASFPVFIALGEADFANARGTDFVFTAANGTTVLPFERERFVANELIAWVAVPSLSSTAPSVLHLYYGDAGAADLANPTAVWDADTVGVWHLGETTGGTGAIRDSTSHANHGTNQNGVALGVTGKTGLAARFTANGPRLRIPQHASLAPIASTGTISLWVSWVMGAGIDYQRLWMSQHTFVGMDNGMEWATNAAGQYYYYPADAGGNNLVAIANPFTNGTWHHVALTQDFASKTVRMFVDGTERMKASDNLATNWMQVAAPGDWYFGGPAPSTTNLFAGMLDEIRVAKTPRSAGWIATEYANQSSPSTFYSTSLHIAP